MASAFAAQLRTIALNSTHELDLRARRNAHAESLLFPKDVAAKQDFDLLYTICVEGFRELCLLDSTFFEFERNLFSTQSVRTEREQMNKSENEALDKVLDRCMAMLGGKLLLKPGVKCLEWLVRRFRVHVYNSTALLLAILPWHEMSIWRNVLSVIPKERCAAEWKFVGMYREEALNVPRKAVVYAMVNNDGFFALLNKYVIECAREGMAYTGLLKFWTGIMIEAVVGRLDATRSGRREIQRQRTQDLLLKVLPLLSDGLEIRGCSELTTACFTLAMVLAGKADLDDRVLDSLLQTVALAAQYPDIQQKAAVVTMTVIIGQKQNKVAHKAALEAFINLPNLTATLSDLNGSYPVGSLVGALVSGALAGVKRKTLTSRMAFVEKVLRSSILITHQIANIAVQAVLARISTSRSDIEMDLIIRTHLVEMLQGLNEAHEFSTVISEASKALNIDSAQLEAMLGSTVATIEADIGGGADAMEIDLVPSASNNIEEILAKLPSRTVNTTSFLAENDRHLLNQVIECFTACSKSMPTLKMFVSHPLWQSPEPEALLLNSFLLRIAVGPFTGGQKAAALQLLVQSLRGADGALDTQALLPYALTALSDSSQVVRRSAADLLITMANKASDDNDTSIKLGSRGLYSDDQASWIPTSHFKKIVSQILIPDIEECVLDSSQAAQLIQFALNGPDTTNQTPVKSSRTELKKSLRHDLFELLVTHAVATPLIKVKMNTIQFLRQVNKVGVSTKSKALAPLLTTWANYDQVQAQRAADVEHISLSEFDVTVTEIISSHDKDAVTRVLDMLEEENAISRPELIHAFFNRVQIVWNDLKHEAQVSSSQRMFQLSFHDNPALAKGAQGVLRSVFLTTDILGTILELSISGIGQMQSEEQQPKKRRRTSHGRDSLPPDVARVVTAASSRLTFALEMVDDSSPENRPELLPVLFDILSTLKRLKQQQRLDLPYLHNLCLSNILATVDAQGGLAKPTIDLSSVRADLVTDCIRSAENPQVQNTALLLSSSLASIVPDRMIHNVMPIFTFMGQSMFSKDDEHSIHVVNQAIDMLIPALVCSLRKQNKDLIKSTSSLLASFTAAFDHIPQYRRVDTYARLLNRMGATDFAFVVLAMLAQRKNHQVTFDAFANDLLTELDADVQLITVQKSIHLANDILLPKPQHAEDIFDSFDSASSGEKQKISKSVFRVVLTILRSKALKAKTTRLHKVGRDNSQRVRSEINSCFSLILTTVRDHRQDGSDLVEEAKQCLDALLALPSLVELFNILPEILMSDDIDTSLKPQALRVLAAQLQNNPVKDSNTRVAAIELLTTLTDMLRVESDVAIRRAIIVCIDPLSEVYGRKDIDAVISAASAVVGGQCLGSGDRRLEVMSLLCLASMLEVLKEGCAPIVPELMSKLIEILRHTVQQEADDEEVHTAAFTLVAAVVSHVSFLVSDENLHALLLLSSLSATRYKSASPSESRHEALSMVARKIELASLLSALLGEDLNYVREHPEDAEIESMKLLETAIEAASKSSVVKNADAISQLLMAHLDQRSRLVGISGTADDGIVQAISNVESKVNIVAIQFIYKLNDTALRPIFESWVGWAANAYDIEDSSAREVMKSSRQSSLFGLLTHFFDTLKSIVTSYASYIIPLSHETLTHVATVANSKKSSQISIDTTLYTNLLNMLRSTFAYDADAFYTAPSHFEPIGVPLMSQLKLAASKSMRNVVYTSVIPTIVALATATLDTPAHHQALSHELVQLRHSASAAVRLSSIKTFAALTADEDMGEEFIANVIGIGSGEGEGARGIGGGGSVGEVMIYVNEMLEDDDEEVEREVRRWVQVVREKTGEDVFEV